jgi:hypothetical protein
MQSSMQIKHTPFNHRRSPLQWERGSEALETRALAD